MKYLIAILGLVPSWNSYAQLSIYYISDNHCPGVADTLVATGDTSYVWYLMEDPNIVLSNSDTLIFMEMGSFDNNWITCATPNDTISFMFYAHASECYCDAYVPNHFTPDGDLFNEEFHAVINCGEIQGVRMTVCNRGGKVVFDETDYYAPRWNGRLHNEGHILEDDVYGWQVSFIKADGEVVRLAGHVTLAK